MFHKLFFLVVAIFALSNVESRATLAKYFQVKGIVEKVEKDRVYFRIGKKLTTVPRSAFEPGEVLKVGCIAMATFEGDPFTSPIIRNTAENPPAPQK